MGRKKSDGDSESFEEFVSVTRKDAKVTAKTCGKLKGAG